jgi:hypothetical protein
LASIFRRSKLGKLSSGCVRFGISEVLGLERFERHQPLAVYRGDFAIIASRCPGCRLQGDPAKEDSFVNRIPCARRLQYSTAPHPKTERVTLISGMFEIAMGNRLERSAAHGLPAGTSGFWPGGMKYMV